jgi:hypothetical protein
MGMACGTLVGEDECVQNFGRKAKVRRRLGRPGCMWKDNNIVACGLKAGISELERPSIVTQRLQSELVSVSAETNTLTTAASETRTK